MFLEIEATLMLFHLFENMICDAGSNGEGPHAGLKFCNFLHLPVCLSIL